MALSQWPDKFIKPTESEKEYVEVDFGELMMVAAESPKAIGISNGAISQPIWIPRSQIETIPLEDFQFLSVTKWFADKKGWLDDE